MTNWNALKNQFDLDPEYIHLSLNMIAPHSKIVREAIEKHRRGFDTNPVLYHENKEFFENSILKKASHYLNTPPEQLALTESTSMGLGVIFTGIKLNQGDEVICSEHDHYALREILRIKQLKEEIVLKTIKLYHNPREVTVEEIWNNLESAITSKTRLLTLTWVHSCSGVKLPLKMISQKVHQINLSRSQNERILIAVDGVHGFGIEDFEVEDLGCDFFITGCHKWLFGPRGTGLIWGKNEAWERIFPMMTSFRWDVFFTWFNQGSPEGNPRAWFCNPGGFQAYEHRWALGEAFDFHQSLGKRIIYQRIHELNQYCQDLLETIPHVKLHTPKNPELSSGMVCFEIEAFESGEVVGKMLKERIIIGQTPYQKSVCRIAPGLLNSHEELDSASSVLRSLRPRK